MSDNPAIQNFQKDLTLHLVRNGALIDQADRVASNLEFTTIGGRTFAVVDGQHYGSDRIEEIGKLAGYGTTADDRAASAAAAAAGKAAGEAQRRQSEMQRTAAFT